MSDLPLILAVSADGGWPQRLETLVNDMAVVATASSLADAASPL